MISGWIKGGRRCAFPPYGQTLINVELRTKYAGKAAEAALLGNGGAQALGHIEFRSGRVKDDAVDIAGIGNNRVTEYLLGLGNVQSSGAKQVLQTLIPHQTIILGNNESVEI